MSTRQKKNCVVQATGPTYDSGPDPIFFLIFKGR